jgi:hypothetical protein
MEIRDGNMDFAYGGSFTEASAEAYERLILDVLLGDPPLFPSTRRSSSSVEDPRPDPRALGPQGRSPSSTRPAGVPSRRDCWPATAALEGLMIGSDTDSAASPPSSSGPPRR